MTYIHLTTLYRFFCYPRVDLFDVLTFLSFRKNSLTNICTLKIIFEYNTCLLFSENHGRTFNYIQYNNSTFKRVMCALNFFKLIIPCLLILYTVRVCLGIFPLCLRNSQSHPRVSRSLS